MAAVFLILSIAFTEITVAVDELIFVQIVRFIFLVYFINYN